MMPQNFGGSQATTVLARSALALLGQASPENIELALNTLHNNRIPAEKLLYELDHRRFSFQRVVGEPARRWPPEEVAGFADEFGMSRDQFDVMDAIVSLAILNDPALESRLRAENQVPSAPADF